MFATHLLSGNIILQCVLAFVNVYYNMQFAVHLLRLATSSLEKDMASPFQICGVVAPKLVLDLHAVYTSSVKVILLNEWQCRAAVCEKGWKQEVPLAILSRILAQSCVNPPFLLRELLVSTIFRILHPFIAIHSDE